MAYSKDYQKMILSKLTEGYSIRQLAEEYQISTNTIVGLNNGCYQAYRKTA